MRELRGICTALLVAAACGGDDDATPRDGGGSDTASSDGGARSDVPEIVWDGPDSIEVLVVDDRGFFGDDVPIEGALVMLDAARGRLTGLTGTDGLVRLAGFSFAEGTVDVTAIADGFPVRTLLHLDGWAEARPVRMAMRAWSEPPEGTTQIDLTFERTSADTALYCWSRAAYQTPRQHVAIPVARAGFLGALDTYALPIYGGLGLPTRIACLEHEVDGGTRTLLSLAEVTTESAATLTFPGDAEIVRSTVRFAYPDPNPYASSSDIEVFVDDQGDDGFGVAVGMMESVTTTAGHDEVSLAWAPGSVAGTATLTAMGRGGGFGWTLKNLPVAALSDPIVVPAPPSIRVEADGTYVIEGADGADDVALFMGAPPTQSWLVVVPRASGTFRLPDPPEGQSWDDVLPGGVAFIQGTTNAFFYDDHVPRDHWQGPEWVRGVRGYTLERSTPVLVPGSL